MARARGFQHRSNRSQRRKTSWGIGPEADGLSFTANLTPQSLAGIILTTEEQATITRIRGMLRWTLIATTVSAGGFRAAVGFGIVNSEAFATGVGAMPSPIGDVDWDGWMYHQFADVRSITTTLADGANAASASVLQEIDVKSQRILHSDNVLMGVAEVQSEVGTATLRLDLDTRVLFILP